MKDERTPNGPQESDEPGEAELRRLFEGTADEASGPLLTRLAARAGDVPERAQRIPRWLPRWAWSPTLAGLAVASGVLLVVLASRFGSPERPPGAPPPAETAAVKPVGTPSAPKLGAPPPTSEPTSMHLAQEGPDADELDELDELDDDGSFAAFESVETTALLELESDWFDIGVDPLSDAASDDDLDAWLAATADLVEDG
jgi:hypothetical protein